MPSTEDTRHTRLEDLQAMVVGTLLLALAVVFLRQAGLLSGGTSGLALVLHYLTGWPFGALFFAINLPFFGLCWLRLGPQATVKTLGSVGLMSVFSEALPHWLHIAAIEPLYAAVMSGFLAGTGLLILMRHRASLGGFSTLAQWLQEARGWRAGHVLMGLDLLILLSALGVRAPSAVAVSTLGAVAMGWVLSANHRPGRYTGW